MVCTGVRMEPSARGRTFAVMARSLLTPQDLGPDPEPVRVPASPPRTGPVLVVGYDGSPPSRVALEWAVRHGRQGGRVIITFATEPVPENLVPRWQDVLREEDRRAARQVLAHAGDDGALSGCSWETAVVTADTPAEGLVAAAREHDADAIVVGSHGRGRVSGLLGSVSQSLVRRSPIAVVILGPETVAS